MTSTMSNSPIHEFWIFLLFFRFGRKNVGGRCWMPDPWSRRLSRKYQLRTIRQDGFGQQLILNSLINEFPNLRILNILWIFPSCERKKNQTILSNSWLFSDWKMGSHLPEGTLFSKLEIDKKTKHVPYYLTIHTTYSSNIKWQKCAGMGLNGFHTR